MKIKTLLFTVISLFVVCHCIAQRANVTSDFTFEQDFLNPTNTFPSNFYIREKRSIKYKLKNFNRQLYNITVGAEQRTFFSEKPPIFGVITDLDLTKLNSETSALEEVNLGKYPAIMDAIMADERSTISKYVDAKKKLTLQIFAFEKFNKKLKYLTILYKELSADLLSCNSFSQIFAAKISSSKKILVDNFSYVGPDDEVSIKNALVNNTSESLESALNTAEEIKTNYLLFKVQLKVLQNLVEKALDKNKEELSKTKITPQNQAQIKSLKDKAKKIIDEMNLENISVEGIDENVSKIKIRSAKIEQVQLDGFTNSLSEVCDKINQSNFEYISPSFKAKEDEMTIKINIEPKNTLPCNSNYASFNGEYTGSIYGFKMNFSSGLFIVMGNRLFDQTYKVNPIVGDPDNNIIIKNKIKDKIQPAFGALMHFYWQRPSWFSVGGAFGLSISNQSKLNYHGGISLLLGETQRVILSGGATLSQAKDITDEYNENQKIPTSLNLSVVPTKNYFRWGSFLALTYNLKSTK